MEGSVERRSRRRGSGVQRRAVTKGEREEEELELVGGGMGTVETSCIERESTTEMELPEAKARRPEGLRSADPKLLRLGGPGSMLTQESCGNGGAATTMAAAAGLGLVILGF